MNAVRQKTANKKTPRGVSELLFILGLLLVFVGSAFMLVLIGADSYKKIAADMQSNFERRTPASYIAFKIRKADKDGQITIKKKEGTDVLVIQERLEGISYETWIYEYKQSLCELFIQKGTDIALADGMSLIEIQGLEMEQLKNNLMKFTSVDHTGKELQLVIGLRSKARE